jgi:hypothetical protein
VIAKETETEGADIFIVYRAAVVGGQLAPGDDASEAGYFGPDELPELAFASTHKIVARWKGLR